MFHDTHPTMDGIRPHLKLLSTSQLKRIHGAALQILERTGVLIHLPEAVDLLADAGAWVEGNNRVRIPSFLVESAIRTVPDRLCIYNRNGTPAMFLQDLNSYYGPGPTIQYVYDVHNGKRRPTDKEDIQAVARLCDYLPNIDFVMTMGMSGGVNPAEMGLNPDATDRHDFAAMLMNTTKPLIFSAWTREGLADIHEMAAAVCGGEEKLRQRPFVILFTQPISPLVIDTEPLRQLLFCSEKQLPIIFSSAPMMGATAPNTIAGSVALSTAEFLSALVLSQLKCPGSPMIFGAGYGPMDFRSGSTPYNGPEYEISKIIAKELAAFYGLPDWSYGGLTDAKSLDAQAAAEAAISLFHAAMAGCSLIHDVGYMEMGMTASWELIVLADELIDSLRHSIKRIDIDEYTLALDLIDNIGPGGNFLTEKHTVDHLRSLWHPKLFDRTDYDAWQINGKLPLERKLTDKVKCILDNHSPSPLAPDLAATVESIVRRAEQQHPKGSER